VSLSRAAFDFYVPGRSRLHRLDPRVKLALVVAGSVVTLLWVNVWLLCGVLLLTHAVLLLSGYPVSRLAAIWRTIGPLLIVVILVWPLFDRNGTAIVELGPLKITGTALLRGTVTAVRLAAVSFIFLLWIGTTGIRELVRGFVRLGLPVSWGMSLTIGLRFIPTFAGIFQTVSDAQKSRGLVIEGNFIQRGRMMLPILVASLVTALRASEQLAMTLEARAFGASRRRTVLRDIEMRAGDWLTLLLAGATAALLAYLTFAHGLGRDLTAPL
jgi:energy-coupling factor transport system permease protein